MSSLPELAPRAGELAGAVISIGNFDGVHLGHRALLERMRSVAAVEQRPSVIVTFFPPAKVLFGDATYLTSADEKIELLREFEPSAMAVIPFTHAFAGTAKEEFVAQLEVLQPSTIVVGADFRFGRGRAGSIDHLRAVAQRVEPFGLVTHEGEVVKSTRIREDLAAGRIERANELLGRPYRASGTVIRGERRGSAIGVPTANVRVPPEKALPVGVFAVDVRRGRRWHGGMANVGPRPSFPEEPPSLEVHLFDFSDDLYDETVTVRFHRFLRGQRRFAGLEELRAQLAVDASEARRALAATQAATEKPPPSDPSAR